jgi:Tfp pilus assembly protein PilZ
MERRKSRRFSVVNLDLHEKTSEKLVGKVVNISQGGLLTISENSYDAGKEYDFFIPFEETINGMVKFEFAARIVWCRPNALKPGMMSVGLEFADNPKIQTMFIEQMIKVYSPD